VPQDFGQSPRSGSGNLKYVITGILLLAGAGGLWVFLQPEKPKPKVVTQAPKSVQRVNPLAQQNFIIEEEELEKLEPEPEPEPVQKKRRTVRRDAWECSGDLPPKTIREIIADNRSQVRTCYERRLKVNNVLQGDRKLKVKVDSSGSVVATAVQGTLRDNEVFSCVRGLAQRWNFPSPSGGDCAVVQVPFNFMPRKN